MFCFSSWQWFEIAPDDDDDDDDENQEERTTAKSLHQGEIVGHDYEKSSGKVLNTVRYDDGDHEDLYDDEVEELLKVVVDPGDDKVEKASATLNEKQRTTAARKRPIGKDCDATAALERLRSIHKELASKDVAKREPLQSDMATGSNSISILAKEPSTGCTDNKDADTGMGDIDKSKEETAHGKSKAIVDDDTVETVEASLDEPGGVEIDDAHRKSANENGEYHCSCLFLI